MRISFIFQLLIISSLIDSSVSKFTCKKLFKKDFQLFNFQPSDIDVIERKDISFVDSSSKMNGTVLTSICSTVKIPTGCEGENKDAKFVLKPKDDSPCIVIKDTTEWEYGIEKAATKDSVIIAKQKEGVDYKVDYKFICDRKQDKPDYSFYYFPNQKMFEVQIHSTSSCGIQLTLFKILSENSLITAVCFTTIGFVLCFMGLKFHKDFLMFFIPLLTLVLGFYFYMSLIEKSPSDNERIMLIFFLVFGVMVLLTMTVLFPIIIYFVICLMSSWQLAIITKSCLSEIKFFNNEYAMWVLVPVFFLVLFGLYLKLQDYFVIINTSLLGSFAFIISLPYYGITNFDFLFNIQINDIDDINKLDPDLVKLVVVFGLLATLGSLVQYVAFKRNDKSGYRNDELKIDLKLEP